MDEMKRIFAMNLTRLIKEKKISQGDLGKAIGVNRTTINMWCNGNSFPTSDKIQLVADYFHVGKSELIEMYGTPTYNSSFFLRIMKYASNLNPENIKKLEERAKELAELQELQEQKKKGGNSDVDRKD